MTGRRLSCGLLPLLFVGWGALAHAAPCATLERLVFPHPSVPVLRNVPQARPPAIGHFDSERYGLRVHYPVASLRTQAEDLVAELDQIYEEQIIDGGYPPPLPDQGEGGDERLDVYLGIAAPAAAITVAQSDVNPSDGRHGAYAYIILEPALPPDERASVLRHEFAHAVQFGIDLSETIMFFEASAVAIEYFAARQAGFSSMFWASDLGDFQGYPAASPFADGARLADWTEGPTRFEYGAALLLLFLDEVLGRGDGHLIRDLWLASVQPDDEPRNEPDWIDGLRAVAPDSLGRLILDFSTWRSLVSSNAVGAEGLRGGERLDGTALMRVRRLSAAALSGQPLSLFPTDMPQPYGCFPLEWRAEAATPFFVRARGVEPASSAVLGIGWSIRPAAPGAPPRRGQHPTRGDDLTLGVSLESGETALVTVCNLTEVDPDAPPRSTPIEVRVARFEAALHDPDDDANDGLHAPDAGEGRGEQVPAAEGGGCQQPGTTSGQGRKGGLVLFSLLGMAIFGVRLWRTWRRRHLYRADGKRRRAEK